MNQFGRVAAYSSSPYCCVYSVQCTVQCLSHCALCTVHCSHRNKDWINMQPHDRTDS